MRDGVSDSGSAAVEVVIVAPLLMLIVMAVIGLGRVEEARLQAEGVAGAAARAASLARSPQAALAAAEDSVTDGAGASCPHPDVSVDAADFRPGGVVRVTVTCRLQLADVTALGLPGSLHVTESMSSGIDRWRSVDGR